MNILLRGMPENFVNPWVKKGNTEEILSNFLRDGLQIKNPANRLT